MSSHADKQCELEEKFSEGAALMTEIIRCDAITSQASSQIPYLPLHRLIQERNATRNEFYKESGKQMERILEKLARQKFQDERLLHDFEMMQSIETVSAYNLENKIDYYPYDIYKLPPSNFRQQALLISHHRYLVLYYMPIFVS